MPMPTTPAGGSAKQTGRLVGTGSDWATGDESATEAR